MQEPLVSVHMITYNHEPYIRKAIECVLAQKTNFPFELVIGEDCSTDGTREIAFDYAKRYPDVIRVITSEYNVGMMNNTFRTSMACRGRYIAYCEGDDYWHHPEKLQKQVDYMETHPHCGLVCSDYDCYSPNGALAAGNDFKSSGRTLAPSPGIHDILAGNGDILTCTVLARRNLIETIIQKDPYLHQSGRFKMGDTQIWAELSLQATTFRIRESLATHLILEESATQSTDKSKVLRFWISNAEMCLYLCDKHNLDPQLKEGHIRNWRRKMLKLAFLEKKSDLAEIARNKYPGLSLKDWGWYWGTKNLLIRQVVLLLNALLKKDE